MHRMFFAGLALWASMAIATEGHPGFAAFQSAEQKLLDIANIEKSIAKNLAPELRKKQISDKTTELQNQAYDQCKISIAAYHSAPSESIDLSALYFCLWTAIENCEGASAKPGCDAPIQSVLQIAQKQLAGKPGTTGLHNLIGGHYVRQKRYPAAMIAYFPAYTQLSKAPCSGDHVNQLLTILNLQLESGDQNGFNQYWKMTTYCEGSSFLQTKGTKFVRDATLNRVKLITAPPVVTASVGLPHSTSVSTVALASTAKPKAKAIPKETPTKADDDEDEEPEEEEPITSVTRSPSPPTMKIAAKPEVPVKESTTTLTKLAPNEQESAVRKPTAVEEVHSSVQKFVPALLTGIGKHHSEWEASIAGRRAKKNKDEKETRELEEIFKAKKENEKKALDQMMSSDPDMRAKQLKNVLGLQLGDSVQKVKAVLGKPSLETPSDYKLSYEQLNTGASVGDLIAGKMPPFVGLVFTFNSQGHLQEIKYSYPQGHSNIVCR
ncbi:MAG: hypothetical protein ACXWC9_03435 [Pseudobdellovibrionaceae bacterium]